MMDVINSREDGRSGGEVPIIPWPFLPKAKDSLAGSLLHGRIASVASMQRSGIEEAAVGKATSKRDGA